MKEILKKSNGLLDYSAEVLSEIVKIPSFSGDEERVIQRIKSFLDELGIENWIDGLGNLIAKIGNGERSIAFDSHIDVVEPGDLHQWEFEPFSGEIKDGYVHGRGSVDQKGGAASMITAARILKEMDYNGKFTIYFTFTVQEEDCDGMCWLWIIEREELRPDYVVLTEPTDLKLNIGHRGRMEIELLFKGKSSHGAMPHLGINAIEKASRSVLLIQELNKNLKEDPFLGKGTITPTMIKSTSPSLCAVPDSCLVHLDRRLTHGETRESAIEELRKILPEDTEVIIPVYKKKGYRGNVYEQEKYFPTWKTEEDHPLVVAGKKAYRELFGKKPVIDKWIFSTNGVAISGRHKIPCIGFGPGDERMAHAPNEKLPVEQLARATAFYAHLPLALEKTEEER